MIEHTVGDLKLLHFERLSREPGVVHAVTTRPQNFAPHHGDNRDRAVYWRQKVCEILNVPFDNLTAPEQVHGGEVVRIEDEDTGCGRDGRGSAIRFVDGLICDKPGVPIILLSADCPLICAYDPQLPAVGAVHASWRGTVAGLAGQMVRQMAGEFGSDPGRLLVCISPSAGPCCYEVDRQVYRVARTRLDDADACFVAKGERYMFNLWTANRRQLINSGIASANIEVAGMCSICNEQFWSYRRDGKDAGRFALFISLI
ncbi:MAG: peptidoglycan editing factor PgeF [Planctomycetota bacterium]|nr:MAG: peptidoglycan editing factor PgeF [Planctomycetota bacterium]